MGVFLLFFSRYGSRLRASWRRRIRGFPTGKSPGSTPRNASSVHRPTASGPRCSDTPPWRIHASGSSATVKSIIASTVTDIALWNRWAWIDAKNTNFATVDSVLNLESKTDTNNHYWSVDRRGFYALQRKSHLCILRKGIVYFIIQHWCFRVANRYLLQPIYRYKIGGPKLTWKIQTLLLMDKFSMHC